MQQAKGLLRSSPDGRARCGWPALRGCAPERAGSGPREGHWGRVCAIEVGDVQSVRRQIGQLCRDKDAETGSL